VSTSRRLDPWLGQTLSGCVIEGLLGRGGMGAAYLARRTSDGAAVVVKLLAPASAGDPKLVARLRREADALRRVKGHPNLVTVHEASVEGPGPPHLVLELAQGESLRQRIDRQGKLAPSDAARIARDVARGLVVLHGHGILHRDVKPDNVIVGPDGGARLIDFGIARDEFLTRLTAPGQLVGTAEYMAPEQWTAGPHDARADLFSLGATLYHALTGKPPFEGATLDELRELSQHGEFDPPREVAPEVPEHLEQLVLHLLEPSPRFRYGRAERVAQDLDRVLAGEAPGGPPALVMEAARFSLVPGRRFLIGSGPRAQVRLAHASVAPEHAEVRREDAAFTVRDLRSPAGTWVGDERLTAARPLEDGDVLRVGEVRLTMRDPDGRRGPPEWLEDLEREERPDPVVSALARAGDPRVIAALLELLEPDPLVERAADEALRAVDPAAAPALAARRARLTAQSRAAAPALLQAVTGQALGADPVAWLSWWFQARGRFSRQVGPERAGRALRLTPSAGDAATVLALGAEPGVVLVGRDERCHLRVAHPTVSRLHATVLRLHRRLILRDEGAAAGTRLGEARVQVGFLDPGAVLTLGEATVTVEGADLPAASEGARVVDAATFQALDEANHPATVSGHVALLEAGAHLEALDGVARALFPDDAVRAAALAATLREGRLARAGRARAALSTIFARDAGPDPAAWRALARATSLPPQVVSTFAG
jgi:pSer/pThr/pTyr-binding forkhead associated (FHA) protein